MVIFGNEKYHFNEQGISILLSCFVGGLMVFFLEKCIKVRSIVDADFFHDGCC